MSLFEKIFGSKSERLLRSMKPHIQAINGLEEHYKTQTSEQIKQTCRDFSQEMQSGISQKHIIDIFALTREASSRVLGLRPFDVQLLGGMVLHEGKISEMKTGEGKTLAATLPAALNALAGQTVHVVTVNDYLAKRDATQMMPLFEFLGLEAGYIYSGMPTEERKMVYKKNIIYGANNEFGFDYLRNNMVLSKSDLVMGKLGYAIIDEIDSILIDEARTPLVISGQSEDGSQLYQRIDQFIGHLKGSQDPDAQDTDYIVDAKSKQAYLTEQGYERSETLLEKMGLMSEGTGLHDADNLKLVHHIEVALRAHALYIKNQHYMVRENQVVIIDEFTGRAMAGRRWGEGLHQAIEAKEKLMISAESKTLSSITYQNFFLLYEKISGMTGTASTEAQEFQKIYDLETIVLPTHQPMIRTDHCDKVYGTKTEKFEEMVKEVHQRHAKKQPILIGTSSIETSEYVSTLLKKENIPHEILNAKQHEREARIISGAGRLSAVTVATNMAGRGTDIVLGGNLNAQLQEADSDDKTTQETIKQSWKKEHQTVLDLGGLCILGMEHHESRRIDNQLRGRSGRQGDPGETRFYISLEDELLRIFASEKMRNVLRTLGVSNHQAIEHPIINRSIVNAQKRVEAYHFGIRKNLLEFDNVANYQRRVFYKKRANVLNTTVFDEFSYHYIQTWLNGVLKKYQPNSEKNSWDWQALLENVQHQINRNTSHFFTTLSSKKNKQDALEYLFPAFKDIYDQRVENAKNSDELKGFYQQFVLQIFDTCWVEHLRSLEQLKQSAHLQAYAQKNPVQTYKATSFDLFAQFEDGIQSTAGRMILSISPDDVATPVQKTQSTPSPISAESFKNAGRNDPCPCASGKKFKYCHGQ